MAISIIRPHHSDPATGAFRCLYRPASSRKLIGGRGTSSAARRVRPRANLTPDRVLPSGPIAYRVAMAIWDDVRRLVSALPETAEKPGREGHPGWNVRGKPVAWERPLRRGDLEALGDAAPDGPILCARVPDL